MPEKLTLFDIDATLLLTGGAGLGAMRQATRELFGDRFRWDAIDSSGGLDPLLFKEAARRSGIQIGAQEERAFRDRYLELLPGALEEMARDVRAMPGAVICIEALRRRPDVVLGLLTGNYGGAAELKLCAIGLSLQCFEVRVFGDEGPSRSHLGTLALEKFEAAKGRAVPPERVLIVGDTPHDVDCALSNGFQALGVATGRHSAAALREAGAHRVLDDLSDATELYSLLDELG